jgi:hypothetical protein
VYEYEYGYEWDGVVVVYACIYYRTSVGPSAIDFATTTISKKRRDRQCYFIGKSTPSINADSSLIRSIHQGTQA